MNLKILAILISVVGVSIGVVMYNPMILSDQSVYTDDFSQIQEKFVSNDKFTRKCISGDFVADSSQKMVEINMAAYQWQFGYCSITVYEGQRITINLKSLDVPHGMAIENIPQVNVFISPETVSTISFEATMKGEFTYYCIVFCGEGHPLHKGVLIVK